MADKYLDGIMRRLDVVADVGCKASLETVQPALDVLIIDPPAPPILHEKMVSLRLRDLKALVSIADVFCDTAEEPLATDCGVAIENAKHRIKMATHE
jgi:hypothetical protein